MQGNWYFWALMDDNLGMYWDWECSASLASGYAFVEKSTACLPTNAVGMALDNLLLGQVYCCSVVAGFGTSGSVSSVSH